MESRSTLRKSLVFAPKEGKEGSELAYRRLAAWLISFEQVLAMHSGPIHDWSGTVRAPRPDGFKTGAWKVQPSSWLAQVTPASYDGRRLHHYVLTQGYSREREIAISPVAVNLAKTLMHDLGTESVTRP